MLEAKDTMRKCSKKKRSLLENSQILWHALRQNIIAHDLGLSSTSQKIVLFSSQEQGIYEELQASRPRPRTLNCVLEDSTSDCYLKQGMKWNETKILV